MTGTLASPLFLLAAYQVAKRFSGNTPISILAAGVLLIAAVVMGFTRFTTKGRQAVESSAAEDWSGTVALGFALLAAATAGFALLSTLAYTWGADAVHGGQPRSADVLAMAYESLMWNLAKAVPLLDVPATLHWTLDHYFTDWVQGAIVLAYKAVVIVPVIYIAGHLFGRVVQEHSPSPGEQSDDT